MGEEMNQGGGPSAANSDIWVVRAGRGGVDADRFLDDGMVAVGWQEVIGISPTDSEQYIRERVDAAYPDDKPGTRQAASNQLIRFAKELKVGDPVATYSNQTRLYHVGTVQSEAMALPDSMDGGELREFSFKRQVAWEYKVSRDTLSADTRNSLGSSMTLFKPSSTASSELFSHHPRQDGDVRVDHPAPVPPVEQDQDTIVKDYIARAEQFVEDQMAKLNWVQMQELVAGILRAMGYHTKVAEPGPDRGVDIFASTDGLGLTEPRVFVEVKHRKESMGSQQIRSFVGGRQPGDRCLYISTGGFSKDARYEAERSRIPVTLLTLADVRELLLEHYESLDLETRALVPLKKVYWPITE